VHEERILVDPAHPVPVDGLERSVPGLQQEPAVRDDRGIVAIGLTRSWPVIARNSSLRRLTRPSSSRASFAR
jgi:hypothetical protein